MLEIEDAMTSEGDLPQATPPTAEEELDLVQMLDAGMPEKTIWLPVGRDADGKPKYSDTYFVRVRPWTIADEQRFNSAGMDYRTAVRTPGRGGPSPEVKFRMDSVEQTRVLVELSIVDYCLRINGQDCRYRPAGKAAVWGMFSQLPPKAARWLIARIREVQGIEMVNVPGGD